MKSAGGAFENRQTIRPSLPGLDDILSADPIFGRRFAAENNRPKSRSTKWQAGNKKSVLEITDQPSFNIIMRKALFYLLPLVWITHLGFAQEQPFPAFRILPEDVVQDSIRQVRFNTNNFAVRWTFTEAGARKILAFRETLSPLPVSKREAAPLCI